MRDSFTDMPVETGATDTAKADALHALGAFYLRQGFPRQGLSLLLAARKFEAPSLELSRAIAHAYLLAGAPQKAIALLDAMEPTLNTSRMRQAAAHLRSRALLALGKVTEARAAFSSAFSDGAARPRHIVPRRRPL